MPLAISWAISGCCWGSTKMWGISPWPGMLMCSWLSLLGWYADRTRRLILWSMCIQMIYSCLTLHLPSCPMPELALPVTLVKLQSPMSTPAASNRPCSAWARFIPSPFQWEIMARSSVQKNCWSSGISEPQIDVPVFLSLGGCYEQQLHLHSINQHLSLLMSFGFKQSQPAGVAASLCLYFSAHTERPTTLPKLLQSQQPSASRQAAVLVRPHSVPPEALCHWGILLCTGHSYPNKAGLHADREEPNKTKSITFSEQKRHFTFCQGVRPAELPSLPSPAQLCHGCAPVLSKGCMNPGSCKPWARSRRAAESQRSIPQLCMKPPQQFKERHLSFSSLKLSHWFFFLPLRQCKYLDTCSLFFFPPCYLCL